MENGNGNGISYKKHRPHTSMEFKYELSRIEEDDKKKKKIMIDNYHTALNVLIVKAEGIDCPSRHPFVMNRHYEVVYWVEPAYGVRTFMTQGMCPVWNQKDMLILDNLDDYKFLNVEVQRLNSREDPGPSTGRVTVGRVRIPFPKVFYREIGGAFPLVRFDEGTHKVEGHIILGMRLERIKIFPC